MFWLLAVVSLTHDLGIFPSHTLIDLQLTLSHTSCSVGG